VNCADDGINCEERQRLETENAELLAALEALVARHDSGGTNVAAMEWKQARAAIARAKGEQP